MDDERSQIDFVTLLSRELERQAAESMAAQIDDVLGYGWQFEYARDTRSRRQKLLGRLRSYRWEAERRIVTAWAVLRGEHNCYDY